MKYLDARFRNPPIGGFKDVECLSGMPWIVSFIRENLVLPVMYDSVHSVLVNCTKNTLLGN